MILATAMSILRGNPFSSASAIRPEEFERKDGDYRIKPQELGLSPAPAAGAAPAPSSAPYRGSLYDMARLGPESPAPAPSEHPKPSDPDVLGSDAAKSAKDLNTLAKIESTASGVAKIMSASVDYSQLRMNADSYALKAANLEIAADGAELQALQQSNLMYEDFVSKMGAEVNSAALRGVRPDGSSIQSNIENSAKNLGEDVQTLRANAASQAAMNRAAAELYRANVDISKRMAKVALVSGTVSGLTTIVGGFYR